MGGGSIGREMRARGWERLVTHYKRVLGGSENKQLLIAIVTTCFIQFLLLDKLRLDLLIFWDMLERKKISQMPQMKKTLHEMLFQRQPHLLVHLLHIQDTHRLNLLLHLLFVDMK